MSGNAIPVPVFGVGWCAFVNCFERVAFVAKSIKLTPADHSSQNPSPPCRHLLRPAPRAEKHLIDDLSPPASIKGGRFATGPDPARSAPARTSNGDSIIITRSCLHEKSGMTRRAWPAARELSDADAKALPETCPSFDSASYHLAFNTAALSLGGRYRRSPSPTSDTHLAITVRSPVTPAVWIQPCAMGPSSLEGQGQDGGMSDLQEDAANRPGVESRCSERASWHEQRRRETQISGWVRVSVPDGGRRLCMYLNCPTDLARPLTLSSSCHLPYPAVFSSVSCSWRPVSILPSKRTSFIASIQRSRPTG